MHRRVLRLTPLVALLLVPSPIWAQEAAEQAAASDGPGQATSAVTGDVTEVTVYQGQALVTRRVELPAGSTGLTEVVVTDLPEFVLPGSLYAEPDDGVEIRSVRYRVRPQEQDVRQEVRDIDSNIQATQDKLTEAQRQRSVLQERSNYLDKFENFTTGTATQELKSGVLNAETLKELTGFTFQQRDEIAEQELALSIRERELQATLSALQRQRNVLAAGSAKNVREAVVFVDAQDAGAGSLRLRYLVSNATWSPSYNLRADDERNAVLVEYNASIQQMSGEDWNNVEMTLSTATPSLVAKAPQLDPLAIQLTRPEEFTPQQQAAISNDRDYATARLDLSKKMKALSQLRAQAPAADQPVAANSAEAADLFGVEGESRRRLSEEAVANGKAAGFGGGGWGAAYVGSDATRQADMGLNYFANELQLLDLNADARQTDKRVATQPAVDEGVSVSYALSNQTSLPSRSDRQLIQIASLELDGDFYLRAVPVLTSYVYKETRLVNDSDMVLLAGPASTFVGGEFVGRGDLPTVAVGEGFVVGLGIDASLRTERELVTREESIQGGNKVVDFTYRLSLENFGGSPAAVRLIDRLPTVEGSDIKVTLVKSGEPVSEDSAYLATDRKKGLLRWDVEVPQQAIGTDRLTLEYTMRIEYDKQFAIAGMTASN